MATINYLEDFLLNSGPKQDCLVHICKYINVYDMVNLSESSKHSELFVEFFNERVLKLISFDYTSITWTITSEPGEAVWFQKVMEHFGSHIQKLKVSLSCVSFEQFMRCVIHYCVPGNLTDLTIKNGYKCRDILRNFNNIPDYGWLEQVRPILHRLETFSLEDDAGQLMPIFKLYQRDLPNLKSLTLKNFDFVKEDSIFKRNTRYPTWIDIFPNELSNVTELYLIKVEVRESAHEFDSFLNQFTDLQVFVHPRKNDGNLQPEVVADCLYRRFPQLRSIACNMDVPDQDTHFAIGNRFNFLEKFSNLAELYITCCSHVKPLDIHSIIQLVPNIKILSIVEIKLFQPPAAIRRIRQAIKEVIDRRRNRFPPNDRIEIIVDDTQYREFMVLKNIDEIIKLSVVV